MYSTKPNETQTDIKQFIRRLTTHGNFIRTCKKQNYYSMPEH